MALRAYSDREGREWRVWRVVPDAASGSTLAVSYRDGWLCFERLDGSERRRLSMTQVPPSWEALSDERLDVLRQSAELASRRSVVARIEGVPDTQAIETAQREARISAPRNALGGKDTRG